MGGVVAKQAMAGRAPASAAVDQVATSGFLSTNPGAAETVVVSPTEPVLRSNFSETAFWQPQLLDGRGRVRRHRVHRCRTRSRRGTSGSTPSRRTRGGSVDARRRPSRTSWSARTCPASCAKATRREIKVVVNNASEKALTGAVTLDILDPETESSRTRRLRPRRRRRVAAVHGSAGGGTQPDVPPRGARRVGSYAIAFKATRRGDLSDGELRPVPVLPGRMHLVAVALRRRSRAKRSGRSVSTTSAKNDDPSSIERADGRHGGRAALLHGAAGAAVSRELPVRVHRADAEPFRLDGHRLSALSRLSGRREDGGGDGEADDAARGWDAPDPNRKMALEETPWLVDGAGRRDAGHRTRSTSSTRASRRPNASRRSRSCASPRPPSARSRGSRADRRRRT